MRPKPPEGRFKPYPAYKVAEGGWLGMVPEHWDTRRLKYVAPISDKRVDSGVSDLPYTALEHIEPWTGRLLESHALPEAETEKSEGVNSIFEPGDVLFGKLRPYLAKVLLAAEAGQCSTELLVLRCRSSITPAYLAYQLLSDGFIEWINAMTYGTKMPRANPAQLGGTTVALPPLAEQGAIVAFLDREVSRVDALVFKKLRLVELLKEKRIALMTSAVTKGLDPTVPTKGSGVEWLGEIPAHWETVALKRRSTRIQTGTTPPTSEVRYYEDGVIPWYGPGSFTDDLPLKSPAKLIAEDAFRDGVARLFDAGSVAVVTIGATIGKVAYMELAGSANQQITAITFDRRVHSKYSAYQLKSLEQLLRGIAPSTTLPILDQEEVGYMPFAVPPEPEQHAIAAFLDCEMARIDALASKVRDAIDRLKELRTALISAAVTGKFDVRGETA